MYCAQDAPGKNYLLNLAVPVPRTDIFCDGSRLAYFTHSGEPDWQKRARWRESSGTGIKRTRIHKKIHPESIAQTSMPTQQAKTQERTAGDSGVLLSHTGGAQNDHDTVHCCNCSEATCAENSGAHKIPASLRHNQAY